MPYFKSRDQTLYYTHLGPDDGRCVVLIHGFTNYSGLWMQQGLALAYSGYKVLMPDLAGHGLSDTALLPTTVSELAADVTALLDHEHVASASLCGLSLGGMVALSAAINYPDRVDRLVVAGSSARADDPASVHQIDGWISTLESGDGPVRRLERAWPRLCTRSFRESPHGEAYYDTWRHILSSVTGSSLANIARGMQKYNVTEQISTIQCPTLIVAGLQDEIISPAESKLLRDNIAGAKLLEIPDAGHLATLDAPLVVTEALEEVLSV